MDNKKAEDYVFLDLRKVNSYLDYFLIATGNSLIHCKSLAKSLRKYFSTTKLIERNKPDLNSEWIILDYNSIVVHIFTEELREYYQQGMSIPWVRIYKVADHVHFPHMRHVNEDAGALACTECHGEVTEIEYIEEVEQPLTMGWCLDCHRENDASRDCAVCHY